MKKNILVIGILIATTYNALSQCACCSGAGAPLNNDNNNGVLTLPKKGLMVEALSDYRTIQEGSKTMHNEGGEQTEMETPLSSIVINTLGLRYGVTQRITLSTILPYVILNTKSGRDYGLGDLILLGTFGVYNKPNLKLALMGGIELPTGVQKGSSFDETTIVVGSGSYDPIVGVTFVEKLNKFKLSSNLQYRYTTRGFEDIKYSSVSSQSLIVSYDFNEHNTTCSIDSICTSHKFKSSVIGGYYGEWLSKIEEDDKVDDNSGYYLGFAMVGATFSYKKWLTT